MKSGEPGTPNCVRFGQFEANFKNGELSKLGNHIRIQGQPLRVLNALLERPGEIVSREEIQQRLWGPDTTVDFDHSLGLAVNKLREALGDSADAPRYIETLARRGYRFIAPVSIVDCPNGAPASVGERNREVVQLSWCLQAVRAAFHRRSRTGHHCPNSVNDSDGALFAFSGSLPFSHHAVDSVGRCPGQ